LHQPFYHPGEGTFIHAYLRCGFVQRDTAAVIERPKNHPLGDREILPSLSAKLCETKLERQRSQ
jgi:hypothetical protein